MRPLPGLVLVTALLFSACSAGRGDSGPASNPTPTTQAAQGSTPAATPTSGATRAAITPTGDPAQDATATVPVPGPSQPHATETSGPAPANTGDNAQFDAIAGAASRLRKLSIESDIREDYLTRDQLRSRLVRNLNKDYPAEEARTDERVLKAFGLIPENTDLRKLLLDVYTEQIAGFYDTDTNQMYVISTGKKLNALGEITYAHEVTHALQDQHFDLDRLTKRFEDKNDDGSLAVTSLVEGDATLLQSQYLISKPELIGKLGQALRDEQLSTQQLDNAPPLISETLTFPYEAGQNFVTTLYQQGSWRAVDSAYSDPPTSTEQILHPDKYTDRDEPTEVRLPDLSSTLGSGWKKVEENLWGEFQTRIMLEGKGQPAAQARTAAEGWDGDEFALYTKGSDEVVAWQTVWDSEKDAGEFAAALRAYDEARFKASYSDRGAGVLFMPIPDGRVAILKEAGNRASYVLAPSAALATQIAGSLGQ